MLACWGFPIGWCECWGLPIRWCVCWGRWSPGWLLAHWRVCEVEDMGHAIQALLIAQQTHGAAVRLVGCGVTCIPFHADVYCPPLSRNRKL
jgi:hypothetical protein